MTLAATEVAGRTTAIGYGGQGTQATRTYHVLSDTQIYGFDTVSGLPAIGDAYPTYSALKCTLVTADESEQLDNGKWLWKVTAHYSTVSFNGASPVIRLPHERDPILSWSSRLVEIAAIKDLDGKPFVNTAGDPFVSAPTMVEPRVILTARFNTATFDGSYALTWLNKINNTSWKGGDKGTVLIEDVSANQKFEESTYWEVSMSFHFNPRGWDPLKIISMGPRYLEQNNSVWKQKFFTDSNGVASTEPGFLYSDGTKIDPRAMALFSVPPHEQQFRIFSYAEFSQLGL